ncbi:MAG: hypothetical protein COA73_03835 [Candidatus Hydrogenedentota bacterium]|nr:MAG: hypothetical protein COA73_03835 [Candidatus Hydrogenedentota bacterium]
MREIKIFTIGFTKKSAEKFFGLLKESGAKRIIDIRLNNVSQLAGFAKRDDLKYFAKELCDMDYVHIPELAPSEDILKEYKKGKGSWSDFESQFLNLMKERQVETTISEEILDHGCLLCSENEPDNCHRKLVADYFQQKWGREISISHLI